MQTIHEAVRDAANTFKRAIDQIARNTARHLQVPQIDIVFDGEPGHEPGRFVEIESPPGESVRLGEWVKRDDGYWVLRLNAPQHSIDMPPNLHPRTKRLVIQFAQELAAKLHAAEIKYYCDVEWSLDDWEDGCRESLYEHLAKGDPCDVAAYCAFMWHHGWSTRKPDAPHPPTSSEQ